MRSKCKKSVEYAAVIAIVGALTAIVLQLRGSSLENVENPRLGRTETDPPLGLLPIPHPADNPITPEKIQLGKQLFFDTRLSRDLTMSCATCHDPAHGFTIRQPVATGVNGQKGRRHPPTLINVAYSTFQFWDGRVGALGKADSLEKQALEPIRDPHEMNLELEEAADRIRQVPEYRKQFHRVFGQEATSELIARAIATFERTLLFGDALFDRYQAGDKAALGPAALRGKELFFWKATCTACHSGPNFTDNGFHPSIASATSDDADPGRAVLTGTSEDRGLFKTPTLREVGRRSPYMHDGSIATLEEVLERYNRGGFNTHYWPDEHRPMIERLLTSDDSEGVQFRKNAAPQLRAGFPLRLSRDEMSDLILFLREALSSQSPPDIQAPPRLRETVSLQ